MNKRGAFLIEILIAMALFAMMSLIMGNYFFKFLSERKKVETYIENENVDELLKHFFQDEANCTATLKGLLHNDPLLKLKLASDPNKPVEFYQDLLDRGKIKNPKIFIQALKEGYALATIGYKTEVLDLKTKEAGEYENRREIPIFVALNDDQSIYACFLKGLTASQCKGDYKNVVFYNESSLVPVLHNLIEEPQIHGTEYKTTMSQIYDEASNTGVQCNSHLYCDRGEWVSSIGCYNSCQDTVWRLGDNKFQPISNQKCQAGETTVILGPNKLLCKKSKQARKKWCPSQKVSVPYSFDFLAYCQSIKNDSNWQQNYSLDIVNVCKKSINQQEYKSSVGHKNTITLPGSDFGKIVKASKTIKIKELKSSSLADLELGQVSLYARCEYTGFFSLLGLTEDSHKDITLSKSKRKTGSKKKQITNKAGNIEEICSAKYITENPTQKERNLSCSVNKKIKICHPDQPSFCPETKSIKDLYPIRPSAFQSRIPQGLPIRFFYNYSSGKGKSSQNFSAFYTVMCDRKNFCTPFSCMPEVVHGSTFRVIKSQAHCGGERPKLDLLFVIDNSGSMGGEQKTLHDNLNVFLDQFLTPDLNLDYHIAVMDTEKRNGLFGGDYLCQDCISSKGRKVSINSAKSILKNRVKTGTYGSREYSLRRPIRLNKIALDFFRKNASLVIFFITDEEDQDYKGRDYTIVNRFVTFLQNTLSKDMKKVLIYLGIPIKTSNSCKPGDSTGQKGLQDMYKKVGREGATTDKLDLCEKNWNNQLRNFGQQIRNSLLQNTPLNSDYDFSKVDKKGRYKDLQCN